ncbi:MAG: hypothetical protein ACD_63C00148G0009 [uncultured bacterium]|nr:MAG: hypothetical protein ACD_63C00148G0009 [uncultured bacterium]
MRIAILLTEIYTMPAILKKLIYAPHELAFNLADELEKRGHKVTIFTNSKKWTNAKKIHANLRLFSKAIKKSKLNHIKFAEKYPEVWQRFSREAENSLSSLAIKMAQRGKFDILHFFMFKDEAIHYSDLVRTPSLFTLHDPLNLSLELIHKLNSNKNKNFVSISKNQRKANSEFHFTANIYNGIDLKKFKFNPKGDGNLIHFGRILEQKGTHLAIDAAKKAREKILIAGTICDGRKNGYYYKKIKPRLGKNARYVGLIKDSRKRTKFLGNAKTFLFPCSWEEPFGLAVIESMACGTPVIAFKRGAIPELMIDGKTGFLVENVNEMVQAIKKIDQIDRSFCRKHVEKYFTLERMANNYERLYQRLSEKTK